MQIPKQMTVMEKLQILSDAAKYDVACTSSGVDRRGNGHGMGNCIAPGICHTFSGDGRCVSLLKILFTNECIFNCSYCQNNCMNDIPRASFTPDEVCSLTMEFYRRNYIEGLFLSSGILVSPNYTMELIYQTLYQLRVKHHFNGYIHVKAIPGADRAHRLSRRPHEHQSGASDLGLSACTCPVQIQTHDLNTHAPDPEWHPKRQADAYRRCFFC